MKENDVVLVVGGTGFIGSHTVVQLLEQGMNVVIMDNEVNSTSKVIPKIHEIVKTKEIEAFHHVDLTQYDDLLENMIKYKGRIAYVIHFAGLKAVGESVANPLEYYRNNISGSINLFRAMEECNVKKIIFSSSATVYGYPKTLPITEDFPISATNPYGRTKLMIEEMIRDICSADSEWSAILLRYFNPVGAHSTGIIGEVTKGPPNNLFPYVAQVLVGVRPFLRIYGNDYPTKDGTGVRDYIHIEDLASGHLAAVHYLEENEKCGCKIYNLGTGSGYSVLEVVKELENASGKEIPTQLEGRRPGDVAECVADSSLAKKELKWEAKKDLREMCADLWNFQSKNPNGY